MEARREFRMRMFLALIEGARGVTEKGWPRGVPVGKWLGDLVKSVGVPPALLEEEGRPGAVELRDAFLLVTCAEAFTLADWASAWSVVIGHLPQRHVKLEPVRSVDAPGWTGSRFPREVFRARFFATLAEAATDRSGWTDGEVFGAWLNRCILGSVPALPLSKWQQNEEMKGLREAFFMLAWVMGFSETEWARSAFSTVSALHSLAPPRRWPELRRGAG